MPHDSNPRGDPENPVDIAHPYWDEVMDDMAATAAEYRDQGWDAIEVHPGDVAVFADRGRTGIELLAPDDEFDDLSTAYDEADGFESAQVFRADPGGSIFLVIALENPGTETVALLPAYYSPLEHNEFVEMIRDEGEVRTHVRPLDERRILTFTHDDPSLFLPPEDEA